MPIRRRTPRGSTRGSEISSPSKRITPSSICSSRLRQRSSVDLPEPDEPIRQTTSCLVDREVDVGEHHPVAVGLAELGHLEESGHNAPARSRSIQRRWSQSQSRASGTVITTKKPATTTSGV